MGTQATSRNHKHLQVTLPAWSWVHVQHPHASRMPHFHSWYNIKQQYTLYGQMQGARKKYAADKLEIRPNHVMEAKASACEVPATQPNPSNARSSCWASSTAHRWACQASRTMPKITNQTIKLWGKWLVKSWLYFMLIEWIIQTQTTYMVPQIYKHLPTVPPVRHQHPTASAPWGLQHHWSAST